MSKPYIKEVESVLSETLINECMDNVVEIFKNNDFDHTNHSAWDRELIINSDKIYVKKITKGSRLYVRICKELEEVLGRCVNGIHLAFHIMGKNCCIQPHTDNHVEYALTLYLNDNWSKTDGGLFSYHLDGYDKEIEIKKNKMVRIKNILHWVTKIECEKPRISIQGFYSANLRYKQVDVNTIYKYNEADYL